MLGLLRELPFQYLLIMRSDKLYDERSILGHIVAGGRSRMVPQEAICTHLTINHRQGSRKCKH